MNELNEKLPLETISPVLSEENNPKDDEAIYSILSGIARRWGYMPEPPPIPEVTPLASLPDKRPPVSQEDPTDPYDLDETMILGGKNHPPSAKPETKKETEPALMAPIRDSSGWDEMERTVIIPKTPSRQEKKEASLLSSPEETEKSRDRLTSADDAWNDVAETIRICTQNVSPENSDLDETLILSNRAPLSKAFSDEPAMIPLPESPPLPEEPPLDDDSDIILETVIIGPGNL